MFRTVASFALATLSLLTSYAIVAAWPDHPVRSVSTVAAVVAPVDGLPVAAAAEPATPPGLTE
jgi:hypothetical protein